MDLIIRDIQKKDFDSVFELLSLYKKYKNFEGNFYTKEDLLSVILSEDRYLKLFVAELDSEIVGFIFFNESFDIIGKAIFIEDNFVLEKYRSKKIGSSLFSKVLGYALENNIEKIKWSANKKDPHLPIYKEIGAKFLEDINTYSLTKAQLKRIAKQKIDFNSDLFTIRTTNNRDLPQIKFFIEEQRKTHQRKDSVDIYELMKYSLGNSQLFKMLLLEVNNEIVGLMTYFDYFSALYGKSSHIQFIYVKKAFNSIGVDRILNTFLIHTLAKNNYNYLTIDVDKNDEQAKKRMQLFEAKLFENYIIVEMNNNSLKKLIDIE